MLVMQLLLASGFLLRGQLLNYWNFRFLIIIFIIAPV
jgi:hypothetical protein